MVKAHVESLWKSQVLDNADEKSSIRFLSYDNLVEGETHPIWDNAKHDPVAARKAGVKARMVTGAYTLQADRSKFNQHEVDPTCIICGNDAENLQHFLLECQGLQNSREPFLKTIKEILSQYLTTDDVCFLESDPGYMAALILDCRNTRRIPIPLQPKLTDRLEAVSRGLVFALHTKRTHALQAKAGSRGGLGVTVL